MKYLFGILLMYSLSSCVSAQRIGDNEEAWVAKTTNFLWLTYWSDYYYCRSHKSEDGRNVEPKCYRAKMLSSWSENDLPKYTPVKQK